MTQVDIAVVVHEQQIYQRLCCFRITQFAQALRSEKFDAIGAMIEGRDERLKSAFEFVVPNQFQGLSPHFIGSLGGEFNHIPSRLCVLGCQLSQSPGCVQLLVGIFLRAAGKLVKILGIHLLADQFELGFQTNTPIRVGE